MIMPFELSPTSVMIMHTTLAVSALIALVLLIRRPFAKTFGAKAAYLLWLAPAARLAAAPMDSQWSLFSLFAPGRAKPVEASPAPFEMVFVSADSPGAGSMGDGQHSLMAPPPTASKMQDIFATSEPVAATPAWYETLDWGPVALSVLAIGTALAIGLAVWRQARFGWLVQLESEPASAEVQDMARDIAASIGLKRSPRIQTGLLCSGPLVTGVFRPTVLLPAWFELDYTREEQAHAILHELMHVKRGDLISLQAASLFLAVQWFNPLAHCAVRAFRSDQEAACDADVLSREGTSAQGYGRTLVKTVRISVGAPTLAAAGLPLAHAIKERLILMQNPKPTLKRRLMGVSLAALIGTSGLALTATAAPQEPEKDEELKGAERDEKAEKDKPGSSYTFSTGSSYTMTTGLDGKQFIILSNPMDGAIRDFEVEIQPRLKELEKRMTRMEFTMPPLPAEPPMPPLPPMEGFKMSFSGDLADLAALESLSELEALGEIDWSDVGNINVMTGEDGVMTVIIDGKTLELASDFSPKDMARFEDGIEAWADRIEANADVFEKRMEAWAETYENRMEGYEVKVEAWSDEFETRMGSYEEEYETLFEEGFEERMEDSADLLEEMVEGCDEMEGDDIAIIEVTNDETGETFSALCVSEDASDDTDRIERFFKSRRNMTPSETARFREFLERESDARREFPRRD